MGLKPQKNQNQGGNTRFHTKMEFKKIFKPVYDQKQKTKKRITKQGEKAKKFDVAKSMFPEFVSEDNLSMVDENGVLRT